MQSKGIYARGASSPPAEYLTVHQEADQATKDKLIAAAAERRAQRNARRAANHNGFSADPFLQKKE